MNRTCRIATALALVVVLLAAGQVGSAKAKVTYGYRGGSFDAAGVDTSEVLYETIKTQFTRLHPDIEVELLKMEGRGYADKIVAMYAAGQAPDIVETWGNMGMAWAEEGLLLDLEPYVARDMTRRDISDFFPNLWDAVVVRHGPRSGMRYGLPRFANVIVFFYNKDLFNKAGLTHLDQLDRAGQWNWDSLVEYGKKLTITTSDDRQVQYGFNTHPGILRAASWIWANGGRVFDFPNDPTRFMMDQPAAIEGLQYLYDLRWKHGIWDRSTPSFAEGTLGIENSTGWSAEMGTHIGDKFEWDIAPRPMGKVDRGNRTSLDTYAIVSQTKNPDAAWKFAKFLVSSEAQGLMAQIRGNIPVRKSLYGHYLSVNRGKSFNYFFEAASDARVDPSAVMVKAREVSNLIDPMMKQSIELGLKPPQVAVEEIAGAIRGLYQ